MTFEQFTTDNPFLPIAHALANETEDGHAIGIAYDEEGRLHGFDNKHLGPVSLKEAFAIYTRVETSEGNQGNFDGIERFLGEVAMALPREGGAA